MSNKMINVLALTGLAMASQAAFASDGTITVTGKVMDSTCTIASTAGGKDFTVALPTVSKTTLAAAGNTAGATGFGIKLSGCTPDSGNVHTHFDAGTTVDPNTGRLTLNGGGAGNVQIQIKNADGSVIKAGADATLQNSKPVALAAGAAQMNYVMEYYATGTATSGAANSSVTYTIAYQ
jgi:major type 1 subunit fimbrin (pilin)